jgi:hypothetical protein
MAPPDRPLLPPSEELANLSDRKVEQVVILLAGYNRRSHFYAILGMACGTLSFLGCLGAYVYLVVQGHPTAAGVVLTTTVLAIIGRMIGSRLDSK